MNLNSLDCYHAFMRDEETGKEWVINNCNDEIEVFLLPEGNGERIIADKDKQGELLVEFDRSISYMVEVLSTTKANEIKRVESSDSYADILVYDDITVGSTITYRDTYGFVTTPEGEVIDLKEVMSFHVLVHYDKYSGQINIIRFVPFTIGEGYPIGGDYPYLEDREEYLGIDLHINYTYGENPIDVDTDN